MNLKNKKDLAKRTFNVGEDRIVFAESRLKDIKEAITKQDMRDLKQDGAIIIKERKGRKKVKKKRKRSIGNIRKKRNQRKKVYMTLTRKLRKYVSEMKNKGEISKEGFDDIRKKIRNKIFRSKSHLRDYIKGTKK
ncbi:MAG TPA: 50S ribosomal protein L19e [Bacillota bacterium]|nr:50S ribosomal protein L19e [Bacillota bacterium]